MTGVLLWAAGCAAQPSCTCRCGQCTIDSSVVNNSVAAREMWLASQVQTLRSQVQLYKLQHDDQLPDLLKDWSALTGTSGPEGRYGPYLETTPINPMNRCSTVVDGDGSRTTRNICGFVYDYKGGKGSGNIWGTAMDGRTLTKAP